MSVGEFTVSPTCGVVEGQQRDHREMAERQQKGERKGARVGRERERGVASLGGRWKVGRDRMVGVSGVY